MFATDLRTLVRKRSSEYKVLLIITFCSSRKESLSINHLCLSAVVSTADSIHLKYCLYIIKAEGHPFDMAFVIAKAQSAVIRQR